jgi:hypothetical protein
LQKKDQEREAGALSLTDYQAKYFAHELTRRFPPDSVEKLTAALVDAQVDLNPHQIDAALTLEAKLAGQSRSRPWKLSAPRSDAHCSTPRMRWTGKGRS